MLRLDVDTVPAGQRYGIPPTNPFKNGGGAPEIFAYGLRNPSGRICGKRSIW